jgi:hypothetical protein
VDPRPRGRTAAAAAQAGHRVRPLLPAWPRLPHRPDPYPRRHSRRRLAQDQPPLHRGELPAQPGYRRRGRGRRRRGRRHTGADRPGLAARAGQRHRPDPRHPAGRPRRGEHRRRRHRTQRRPARAAGQPDAGLRRAPQRSEHGRHRPLTTTSGGALMLPPPAAPIRRRAIRWKGSACRPGSAALRFVAGAVAIEDVEAKARQHSRGPPAGTSPGRVGPQAARLRRFRSWQ